MTTQTFESLPAARGPLRTQVARHPLVTFVALAYAISWTCWLVFRLVETEALNGLLIVGATGPALAAMIVSVVLAPEPSGGSMSSWCSATRSPRWLVFHYGYLCAPAMGGEAVR